MKLIRGLHNLTNHDYGCVLTIGNFDGVHRGHQSVLEHLQKKAKQLACPSMLMIFEPYPNEFFKSASLAPARLSNLTEKLSLLKSKNIDKVLLVKFNKKFSNLSPENFIAELLVKKLGVKFLTVGEDFHFGYQRQGNFELLKNTAEKYNFAVTTVPTLVDNGIRISSTQIREALAQGDFEQANYLLGYKYHMIGHVQYGDKRGRTIGFPTANIALNRNQSPLKGVFSVTVDGLQKGMVKGIANLGTRPTVDGLKTLLEVHLFDFNQTIYGKKIKVTFEKKIRNEIKFSSFDELRQQIIKDVEVAKNL